MPKVNTSDKDPKTNEPLAHPPSVSEGIGAVPPEPSVASKTGQTSDDVLRERDRLDRIGVKSDDMDQNVRGVNIVAEGHHGNVVGEVVLKPRPVENSLEYSAKYKMNEYGDTMPAHGLATPMLAATNQPGPQPPPPPPPALKVSTTTDLPEAIAADPFSTVTLD